ncbi:MAG TPA: hypothetical protein PKL84_09410 [Candidatus Hydrogenedentes bacterium]|nr:hypothetical protein [Candidatus Hydrogenedentota bacterium]
MAQDEGLPGTFVCPVCGAKQRVGAGGGEEDVACSVCGMYITNAVASPSPPGNAFAVRVATKADLLRLRAKWGALLAGIVAPLLILAPMSLLVGASGSAQSLRLCTVNLLLAALHGYALMVGSYSPEIISRIVRVDMDRRLLLALFLPAFLVALFLGYYTYSP